MKIKVLYILLSVSFCNSSLYSQDWADEKDEKKTPRFFVGVNMGVLFANNNTAAIYNGSSANTLYGVEYILSVPYYKPTFDNYFKYRYTLAELPLNPAYKTTFDLGLHSGINIGKGNSIYLDINFANLKYEQFFTILIDDPTTQSIEPTYEQVPILGEERRINFNLGTQVSLFNKDKSNLYWSFFGNFNSIKLERNYIIINSVEYEITHSSPQISASPPGGIGYGAGSGIGFKYRLTEKILVDLTYNLSYIKTKMNDNIQGFGINHGIIFRVIWN